MTAIASLVVVVVLASAVGRMQDRRRAIVRTPRRARRRRSRMRSGRSTAVATKTPRAIRESLCGGCRRRPRGMRAAHVESALPDSESHGRLCRQGTRLDDVRGLPRPDVGVRRGDRSRARARSRPAPAESQRRRGPVPAGQDRPQLRLAAAGDARTQDRLGRVLGSENVPGQGARTESQPSARTRRARVD